MARHRKTAADPLPRGPSLQTGEAGAPADGGGDAVAPQVRPSAPQAATAFALAAALDAAESLAELQRRQAGVVDEWGRAISAALAEMPAAGDPAAMLSVSVRLARRQAEATIRHCGELVSLWMESEVRRGHRLRGDAAQWMAGMVPRTPPVVTGSAAEAPLPAALRQWQDAWLGALRAAVVRPVVAA